MHDCLDIKLIEMLVLNAAEVTVQSDPQELPGNKREWP